LSLKEAGTAGKPLHKDVFVKVLTRKLLLWLIV